MRVEIRNTALDPWLEVSRYEAQALGRQGKHGAAVTFVGTMRDFNEGTTVHSMTLEYYPGMTERYLQMISEQAIARWKLLDGLIIHRVGEMHPGDPIVVVAVWSAHRAAAFDACRFLIEELKSRAPFWKKERLEEGFRWVEKNSAGI